MKAKIAIFASGSGSNAENIIKYFNERKTAEISAVFCNNTGAYVLERAKNLNVPAIVFNREEFRNGKVLADLKALKTDLIILAGFLWLIPEELIAAYPDRIINIHPALLPSYGGKGMYGSKVHQAVIAAAEKESGISIHLVNQHYDEGEILFQAKTPIEKSETAESLAEKIHQLEHEHFPRVIEEYLGKISDSGSAV